jgi:hypothetical protein
MQLHIFRKTTMVFKVLFVFAAANALAQSVMSSLGVKEEEAKRQTAWALSNNRVPTQLAASAFKAADAALRPKLVQGALAWIRTYTESPAFKADYDKQRESARPAPPKPKESIDSELAKQKAERHKGLEDMRKNLEKMPPEMRKSMEATVKQMEATYASQDADPKMAALMRQNLEMQRAEEEKSYRARVEEFEKRYPADPRILIAQRLQGFLDLSKDVDFNAKLLPADRGKMKFVDAAYEAKSADWKLCYRAGKPAVEAARTFAGSWLKDLQGK